MLSLQNDYFSKDFNSNGYIEDKIDYGDREIILKGLKFESHGKHIHGKYTVCKGATIHSIGRVQEEWDNTQTQIVIPSKSIIQMKKSPVYLIGCISIKSGSGAEGYIRNGSGEGTRIMNTKFYEDISIIIKKYRNIKQERINKDLKHLINLNDEEFKFVSYKTPTGRDRYYYEMFYTRGGFVLVDIRIMDYLIKNKSNSAIQLYFNLLWICRNGWTQITRREMCKVLGLSQSSEKIVKKYIDELLEVGLVQIRTSYKQEIVLESGIPRFIKIPVFEYMVTDIDDDSCYYECDNVCS